MLDPLLPLVQFVLPTLFGVAVGLLVGAFLHRRGVRAATALEGLQPWAWGIVLAGGLLAWALYTGVVQDILPAAIQPYTDLVLPPLATALAGFVVGFLPALERDAWREAPRRRPLVLGLAVTLVLLTYLGWLSLPVRPSEDLAADGVVFQTTPYTCAAASVATIGRLTGASPGLTEGAAAELARTTFGGTFASGELRALRGIGLSARFGRRLTLDSLVRHGGPALLHVNEPLPGGRRIRHTVALMAIDTVARTITVGNPLEGVQHIEFDRLDGYWIGEAVLVSAPAG